MCHRGRANKMLLVAKETFFVIVVDRGTFIIDGAQFLSTFLDLMPKTTLMDAESSREPKARRAHRFPCNYERFILRKSSGVSTKRRSRAINAITLSNKGPFRERNDTQTVYLRRVTYSRVLCNDFLKYGYSFDILTSIC